MKAVVIMGLALVLSLESHPLAQSPAGAGFEVISIKTSDPNAPGPFGGPAPPTIMPPVGGRFVALNMPLRQLLRVAYDLPDFQLVGGPDWQTSRRFDIQARAEAPVTGIDAMRPLLKQLLADRFQLRTHTEMREIPIYALMVSRDDQRPAKIVPSTINCSTARREWAESMAKREQGTSTDRLPTGQSQPCAIGPVPTTAARSMRMRGHAVSMAELAAFLTPQAGRLVQDRTGLSGLYDWELTFSPAVRTPTAQLPGSGMPLPAPPPSDSPSLTTALQEQLGLKLEAARGPVEVIVIDSAALPDSN